MTADEHQSSFWGDENVLEEIAGMVAHPCECTKTTKWYFKIMNFMECEFYLSKKEINNKQAKGASCGQCVSLWGFLEVAVQQSAPSLQGFPEEMGCGRQTSSLLLTSL